MFAAISEWFQNIFKNVAWDVIVAHFQWNDWMLLTLVMMGIFYGAKQGFVRQIVEIVEACFIISIIMEYYPGLAEFLKTHVPIIPWNLTEIIAFFSLMVTVWVVVAVVDRIMKEWVHAKTLVGLKLVGGIVLGVFHFLMITSLITQGIMLIPAWEIKKVYEPGNSYTGVYMADFAKQIHGYIFHPAKMFAEQAKSAS